MGRLIIQTEGRGRAVADARNFTIMAVVILAVVVGIVSWLAESVQAAHGDPTAIHTSTSNMPAAKPQPT